MNDKQFGGVMTAIFGHSRETVQQGELHRDKRALKSPLHRVVTRSQLLIFLQPKREIATGLFNCLFEVPLKVD